MHLKYEGCSESKASYIFYYVGPWCQEAGTGSTAVEAEPTHQYSVTCCCRVTDGSRGAVWQNGIWHGSMFIAE